jgi:signal transduction histidine kinase
MVLLTAAPVLAAALGTASTRRLAFGLVAAVVVGSLLGAGTYAWRREPSRRFGLVLVLTGVAAAVGTTLAQSSDPGLYSVGRLAIWLIEPLLIYLFLSYPSGRLTGLPARIVVATAAGVVLFLCLPSALLDATYPSPVPWAPCIHGCPHNALAVTSEPAIHDSVVRPVREAITVVTMIAAAALLFVRANRASPLMRRTLAPMLIAAGLNFGAGAAFFAARRAGIADPALVTLGWVAMATVAIAAVAFVAGLLRWRLYTARVLEEMTHRLHEVSGAARLRDRMAEVLGDPSIELYYAVPGDAGWRDAGGREADPSGIPDGRCVAMVPRGPAPTAAIVCDGALRDQRGLVESVGECALAALERERLTVALDSSLRELEASRARLATAAVSERQRIERDLHDGAQQRLVTLRVRLELAIESIERDPSTAPTLLDRLGPEVDEIIDDVRSLARGIYPSLLDSGGLVEALRAAAVYASLPVEVRDRGVGRYSPEIEGAVYFCCLEALQNAAKHAAGASRIAIELDDDGELCFVVSDDGGGFDPAKAKRGAGITNMRDRLAAAGGTLALASAPGAGTTVTGRLPVDGRREGRPAQLVEDDRADGPEPARAATA